MTPMHEALRTSQVSGVLDLWERGDSSARERLMAYVSDRLRSLASAMLRSNPVRRWEQSDDLLQQALVRLNRSIERARPAHSRALLELAALEMRHALVDLARHYFGPCGVGHHHHSRTHDEGENPVIASISGLIPAPSESVDRAGLFERLYAAIDALPSEEREVVDLVGIHELTQQEAAAVLGVTLRTIGRRWRRARLLLFDALRETPAQV